MILPVNKTIEELTEIFGEKLLVPHSPRISRTDIIEKMKAITDAKNAIANFSIDIAQKVIAEELDDKGKQEALIEKWLEDCHFN